MEEVSRGRGQSGDEAGPARWGRDWERKGTRLRWQDLKGGLDLGLGKEELAGKEWGSERE